LRNVLIPAKLLAAEAAVAERSGHLRISHCNTFSLEGLDEPYT
jgi:hypothetical protein